MPFNEDPEKASKNKDKKTKLTEKLKNKRQGVDEKENTDFQVYACTGLLVVICLVVVVIKVFLENLNYEQPTSIFSTWFREQMEDLSTNIYALKQT